jgi:hypothetical protein
MMLIPGLSLLQTYFVIGFGLGVATTLLILALIALIKTS